MNGSVGVFEGPLHDDVPAVGEGVRHETFVDDVDRFLAVGHSEPEPRGLLVILDATGRDDAVQAEAARKRAVQLDPMIGLLRSSMSAMETQAQKGGSSAAKDSLLPSTSIEDKTE